MKTASSRQPLTGILSIAAIAMWLALAWFYASAYSGHLLWQEQNQIFLNDRSYIAGCMKIPGWIATIPGEWLTQFYSDPSLGALILMSAILCCATLLYVILRRYISEWWAWAAYFIFGAYLAACSMNAATPLAFFIALAEILAICLIRIELTVNGRKRDISWLSFLLAAIACWLLGLGPILGRGFASATLPQMKYEERLRIAEAYDAGDLETAKNLALKAREPDDVTAFYYYLSCARTDSLPDNLLKYPHRNLGTLTTIGEQTPLTIVNMMNDLYFELGDMTYAERAAMMRNVFSPRNRNVRMIRKLAEINLVSGDTLAALKYLRILDRTHAYADWSRAHRPGSMQPDAEAEIKRRRANANAKDNIRLGDNCRNILLELLESNPANTTALDYLLCTDLLLKDMDTFKMDYDAYCTAPGRPRLKDLYQQALMIWLAGTDAPLEEWDRYIVAGPRMQAFRAYSDRRGDPAFSGTYWYYFDRQQQ